MQLGTVQGALSVFKLGIWYLVVLGFNSGAAGTALNGLLIFFLVVIVAPFDGGPVAILSSWG